MDVTSLGFRTDLAVLTRAGSTVEDRGDHLVVRTAANPGFWWGNFLLLQHAPAAQDTDRWLDRFGETFPQARHVALGIDSSDGSVTDLAGFAGRGMRVAALTVMTADSVRPPPRPNGAADYRRLVSDDDWAQSVAVQTAVHGEDGEDGRLFVRRRVAAHRATVEAGHGAWFGAFLDGRLVAQLGLLDGGAGLARFQAVETLAELRGQGLAGTLVHHAGREAVTRLGAPTMVMVAEPDYVAIRVYRSLGFVAAERQLQTDRAPAQEGT